MKDGSDIATIKEHTKVEDILRQSEPGPIIPGRLEKTALSGGISLLHSQLSPKRKVNTNAGREKI